MKDDSISHQDTCHSNRTHAIHSQGNLWSIARQPVLWFSFWTTIVWNWTWQWRLTCSLANTCGLTRTYLHQSHPWTTELYITRSLNRTLPLSWRFRRRRLHRFTDEKGVSYEELVKRLQDVAKTRPDLSHHSGGKLNLSICNWYWEWESGHPKLR